MDKLQAMEVFVRVVETGGITRAAESLNIPKATAARARRRPTSVITIKPLGKDDAAVLSNVAPAASSR